MIRLEQTVLDIQRAVAVDPAHEAAVRMAVATLEAAVELTVADGDSAIQTAHKAAVGGITIHTAVNRHRRTAVLDADGAACQSFRDEAGSNLFAGSNGTCRMQVTDSGSGSHIAEGGNLFLREVRPVEGNGMSAAVEGAAVVSYLASTHVVANRNVGSKDGIHIVLILRILNHLLEFMPVSGIIDGEQRRIFHHGVAVHDV